jgi:hypothetical protein
MWVHTVNRSIDDNTQRGSVMWVYTVNRSIEDKTQTGSVMWAHASQQVNRRQDTDRVGHVVTHGSVGLQKTRHRQGRSCGYTRLTGQ